MTRIEYLVAHPYEVEKSDIPLLKKEVEKYPYFYTLRALLLYGLKKENHPSFEDYLNKTSIHSSNRADLYHYINSEKLPETETLVEEPQPEVETIEPVNTEEIVANDFSDETVLDEIQTEENEETNSFATENSIEPIVSGEKEKEVLSTEEIVELNTNSETEENEDIVDEMIENDTEESELRTDHVVDIISDDELNEVAEITNEVVESTKIETKEASVLDIENAILQTSSIEIKVENLSIEEKIELIPEKIETVEKVEEKVIVQETENVSTDNTFSFSDWLKKVPSQSKDEKTIAEEQETAEREIKYKLIDDFLEKNPKIIPMKKTDITPIQVSSNFSHNSEEYSDLMTETLAQIYIEQKKYDKAIKAYKILILKYPEKNSLFANRIKGIENLKNSK